MDECMYICIYMNMDIFSSILRILLSSLLYILPDGTLHSNDCPVLLLTIFTLNLGAFGSPIK